jgi:MFS transporter, SP family, xylose:H+ symportor
MKINRYLLGSAVVAALGGLLFGFDTAVIAGAEKTLQNLFNLSDQMHGFTGASALIGTIIGALIMAKPADVFGRRGILFVLALLYFVSAIGCALAWNWYAILFFRFVGGLGVGGASVIAPMYIAEISPARYRGRLVAITQFNIVLGILLAYLSNWLIGTYVGPGEWRWMLGVQAVPSAIFFLLLFTTPQSPRWLIAQGRLDEARAVLLKCGAETARVDEEVKEIQASLDMQHHTLSEPFFCRKYLKPILLAVAIAAFNQLSGINALIYYTSRIFQTAGASPEEALLRSVAIGFTNLVFTMLALTIIDHFGRKRLMLVGSFGYILSLGAAAIILFKGAGANLLFISLLVFIASHAFGQGAVIWVFISEIFPTRVRARGQALGSLTHWVFAAAITYLFPLVSGVAGWAAFAVFALCMVGQLLWVVATMPETKGISLEQIQRELGIE